MKTIRIDIKKPIYGSTCAIRDIYIKKAIREGKQLEIHLPHGVGYHDPREWVRTGTRMEKVFLIPEHPMVLYQNTVKINED